MAGMDETQDAVSVHDEVAAQLGCIIAMRVVKVSALEPAFDVQPHHARMMRAQFRTLQSVGLIDGTVIVKQDSECTADILHPLLQGG